MNWQQFLVLGIVLAVAVFFVWLSSDPDKHKHGCNCGCSHDHDLPPKDRTSQPDQSTRQG